MRGGLANAVPDLVAEVFLRSNGRASPNNAAVDRMQQIGVLVDQLEFPLNVAAVMEARNLSPGQPKSVFPGDQRALTRWLVIFAGSSAMEADREI